MYSAFGFGMNYSPCLMTNCVLIVLLGCGLLCAPWLSCFKGKDGQPWKSESSRFGYGLLVPLTVAYVCANAFVLVFSFFPSQTKAVPNTKGQIITALAGPIAGHSIIAFGVIWWAWDRKILPRLGYHFKVSAGEISYSEAWKADTLKVTFSVSGNPLQIAYLTVMSLC